MWQKQCGFFLSPPPHRVVWFFAAFRGPRIFFISYTTWVHVEAIVSNIVNSEEINAQLRRSSVIGMSEEYKQDQHMGLRGKRVRILFETVNERGDKRGK